MIIRSCSPPSPPTPTHATGEPVDKTLMKAIVQMLVEVGNNAYRTWFEDWYIEDAREFYKNESSSFIAQNTVSDFLKKAEKRIAEERNRVQDYLDLSSLVRVDQLLDEEWVLRHYEGLTSSGCREMFFNDRVEDLKRMYLLLARCPDVALKPMHKIFSDCIKEAGAATLSAVQFIKPEDGDKAPVQFIKGILGRESSSWRGVIEHNVVHIGRRREGTVSTGEWSCCSNNVVVVVLEILLFHFYT